MWLSLHKEEWYTQDHYKGMSDFIVAEKVILDYWTGEFDQLSFPQPLSVF